MALSIITPRFSFVQFAESNVIQSCNFQPFSLCLPVYLDNDVNFQFVLRSETEEEADALCDLDNDLISVGIVENCEDEFILNFKDLGYKPERYRISSTDVLYNWKHGFPNFTTVISRGQCFAVKIIIGEQSFCSVCFQRIGSDCHTSVIEYGSDENAFDFNYCNSAPVNAADVDCEPLIVEFTNEEALTIPYTAQLMAKYGTVPNVQVWIYDTNGELVDMGITSKFDAYPPTQLIFDFGGPATGIIRIS